ncbi:hypothetical protein HNP46_000776 [Pseudomonas nitritireducens]|uniref:Uncharacterized protein n=1 Tax=Pseudomonas nitroreducens TaxID=46680 RepID=A0A7W7KGM4_PSENT|nr:hypothetical protein [Pseudomonas nitritireducens]
MSRERCRARDGPSARAPETPFQRGNFSPKRKTGCRGKTFAYFGSLQSRSPEGAKHRLRARTEATQNTQPKSIADKVRSYVNGNAGARRFASKLAPTRSPETASCWPLPLFLFSPPSHSVAQVWRPGTSGAKALDGACENSECSCRSPHVQNFLQRSMADRAGRPPGLPGTTSRFANPVRSASLRLATSMAALNF